MVASPGGRAILPSFPQPVRTTVRLCNRDRLPPQRSPCPRLRGKGTRWWKPAQSAGFLFPGLATFQTGTMAPLWERLQPRALRVAPPPTNGRKGVPRFELIQKAHLPNPPLPSQGREPTIAAETAPARAFARSTSTRLYNGDRKRVVVGEGVSVLVE